MNLCRESHSLLGFGQFDPRDAGFVQGDDQRVTLHGKFLARLVCADARQFRRLRDSQAGLGT